MGNIITRNRGRKIIKLPSGEEVPVTVITELAFIDPNDRFQEIIYSINNTATADRDVHVDDIYPSVDGVQDTSRDPLKVERVDVWKYIDPNDRYQERGVGFDNKTGSDSIPPHFSAHQSTHIYRHYKNPGVQDDSGPWIDTELLDIFVHVDPNNRYQEKWHTLTNNPAYGDMTGAADESLPLISGYDGSDANPVRLDPFQNIVNYKQSEANDQGLVTVDFYIKYLPPLVTSDSPIFGTGTPLPGGHDYGLAESFVTAAQLLVICYAGPGQDFAGFPFTTPKQRYDYLPASYQWQAVQYLYLDRTPGGAIPDITGFDDYSDNLKWTVKAYAGVATTDRIYNYVLPGDNKLYAIRWTDTPPTPPGGTSQCLSVDIDFSGVTMTAGGQTYAAIGGQDVALQMDGTLPNKYSPYAYAPFNVLCTPNVISGSNFHLATGTSSDIYNCNQGLAYADDPPGIGSGQYPNFYFKCSVLFQPITV